MAKGLDTYGQNTIPIGIIDYSTPVSRPGRRQ